MSKPLFELSKCDVVRLVGQNVRLTVSREPYQDATKTWWVGTMWFDTLGQYHNKEFRVDLLEKL